jgi:hypothetical protein
MSYDYIIIGGGPCGLTCALYLSELGRKVMLIERSKTLGGCHRVLRTDDGLFTEHGPRIYSSAYKNVDEILKIIGTTWDETFTPYNFNFSKIQGKSFDHFSKRELFVLTKEFLAFLIFFKENRTESVKQFASRHNFSEDAKDYMDRICRLTDGAGYDRYTVFQFLQLVNQNLFGKLYQPRNPNDQHLFELWGQKLVKNGVKIVLNTEVDNISDNTVSIKDGVFNAKKIILCIPPKPFLSLSKNVYIGSTTLFDIYNKTVDITSWVDHNSYSIYIPITFHWKTSQALPKVWGFPSNDWGIAFIVISDYMKNVENGYTLVITTCITRVDTKSKMIDKTAMECNDDELINETFRQLKTAFPDLGDFDKAIVYDKMYDTAYVSTENNTYVPSNLAKDVYYVGTQNGNSFYSFSSMESAVTNALFAIRGMEDIYIHVKDNNYTVRKIFWVVAMCCLMVIILLIVYKKA